VLESIERYFGDMDIVITEGFKKNKFPKIEVHRKACGDRLLYRDDTYDPTLIAVASDSKLEIDVPVFDLNDAKPICDFIETRFLKK
jgi:molybdopterin-guanine dinucleotide biosynthesis protein MobB